MDKVVSSAADAVSDIPDGATLAVGGFGLCGIPSVLIQALHDKGVIDLEVASNNCGVDDWGLGILLADRRIRRMISSYVGENKEFARQYLSGELEVELTPHGHLGRATARRRRRHSGLLHDHRFGYADRRRRTAVAVCRGRLGCRRPPTKQVQTFEVDGVARDYVLEEAIRADFGLVRAWKGDRHGNLVFNKSSRNFNPLCAMSGKVTIAEVEELVEPGELDPDSIHLPGIYVQRVVPLTPEQAQDKRIERRTVRAREGA
jgi:3-oxoacid CoA-transferase, A subunit